MNKSANRLTVSPHRLSVLLFLAALIAYSLPWVANPGVSLTLGAYDLAEWTSLSRDVDMMNTVLLLRLPPVLLVLAAALTFGYPRFTRAWWFTALFTLLMTALLLPPIEFIQDTGNTNYRQQLMVAGLAFISGIVGLSGLLPKLRPVLIGITVVIAATIGFTGISQAMQFMVSLGLPATIGIGAVSFMIVVTLIGVFTISRRRMFSPAVM